MYKKTIKYTDYDGNERSEDFYFNISKAELLEMQLNNYIKLDKKLKAIVDSNDFPTIVETFKDIIKMSYGIKSDDGKRFTKSEKAFEEFASTEAYSNLFIELSTDAKSASEFINKTLPQNVDWDEIFRKANADNVTSLNSGE